MARSSSGGSLTNGASGLVNAGRKIGGSYGKPTLAAQAKVSTGNQGKQKGGYLGGQGPVQKNKEVQREQGRVPGPVDKVVAASQIGNGPQKSLAVLESNSRETDQLLREIRGLTGGKKGKEAREEAERAMRPKSISRLDRLNVIHEKAQNGTLVKHVLSKINAVKDGAGHNIRSDASSRFARSASSNMIVLARDQNRILDAANGRNDTAVSAASSHRWQPSLNPNESVARSHRSREPSVAGSAGEELFHNEIRSVVEQEVVKLLAPLEQQLREERERREAAERKLREISRG